MEAELYRFPNKVLRAKAIKRYMDQAGYKKAVCFSCGNASKALKAEGIDTIDVSIDGDLTARRWFKQYEVKDVFPNRFDATSGHLPFECMVTVAEEFKNYIRKLPRHIFLPTGSGETLLELKIAFPDSKITAVYNLDNATEYDDECVLNCIVKALAEDIVFDWNSKVHDEENSMDKKDKKGLRGGRDI